MTLLRLLTDVDPAAALRAAIEATAKDDASLQREALRHLEGAPFSPETARGLHHLVLSRHEPVRLATLPIMAARGGPRVFPALRAHVEKHAARLSVAEAEAAGRGPRPASARPALDAFGEWLRPKDAGFLGKLVKVQAGPPCAARGPRRPARDRGKGVGRAPPAARGARRRRAAAGGRGRARGTGRGPSRG